MKTLSIVIRQANILDIDHLLRKTARKQKSSLTPLQLEGLYSGL